MSRFSLIFSSRPLLILMSPCLNLMVEAGGDVVVISSMYLSMEATVLAWCSFQRRTNFSITFSLYFSHSHLFRFLEVQIGWSLMCVRMCSANGQ